MIKLRKKFALNEKDEKLLRLLSKDGRASDTALAFMMGVSRPAAAQPETAKRIVGKSRDGMTLWYQCDMCNEPVDAQDNFCRGCGRRLTDG